MPETQTIVNSPAPMFQPFIQQGLNAASMMLQQGGPQQYGGPTVVPFSQQTQQGLDMQANRAMQGSPLVQTAQGATQGIAGGQINPLTALGGAGLAQMSAGGSNPYLDATFNRAAGAVGRNMDSFFARSGRDLEAQTPFRGEALASLGNQIYGGAYENDAQRRLAASQGLGALGGQVTGQQLAASQMAPGLANQDYLDIAQLRDVGSTVENLAGQYQQDAVRRFDFEQARPEMALDAFLQRIGQTGSSAFGTQRVTQPTYTNRGVGALGGALAGYALGGDDNGGIGALIGGLLGGRG